MTERVGFAGTGLMGRGMAKNILAAGYPLAVVAHHSRAPIEELVEQGATELPAIVSWPPTPTCCSFA